MKTKSKQKVFMVLFDYSDKEMKEITVELFDTYEKAKARFFEIINYEKNDASYWVSKAFNENNEVTEDYELETNINDKDAYELWWNLNELYDTTIHEYLDLQVKEIN